VRLGYTNVIRYPAGYLAWKEQYPNLQVCEERSQRLQPGQFFPPCVLTATDKENDFAYLGLHQESATFFLADIQAEYVLLKYYGEHCSLCVQEVPLYNRLFGMIEDDPWLKPRLKMLGIGVGDNQRSVLLFRRAHNVPYPLLADERRVMFDSVGAGEIPLLYLVKILPDARVEILFYHEGHIEDPGVFFQKLRSFLRQSE
jgi:peroxiredoxin